MAEQEEERSRDDLADEASTYKLEELRQKGQVAQSRELTAIIGLIAAGSALYLLSQTNVFQVSEYMRSVFSQFGSINEKSGDQAFLFRSLIDGGKIFLLIVLPIAAIGFLFGGLASFSQIGSVFSTDPLTPDLNKLDPIKGFKKLVSMKTFLDGLRLTIRAIAVMTVAYFLVKAWVIQSPVEVLNDPSILLVHLKDSSMGVFYGLCAVLVVFAGFDYWLQKWEFSKNVRLTRREQKEETKEHEGDPLIKARIRSIQREASRRRMMEAVKKADVVITNPTHIAVALQYDKEKMNAPKVIAKGADFLAQKIKKIAADAGIPMVENVPLARTLYKTVKIGKIVPRALYQAVAEVLAYVYRLKRRADS